MDITEQYEQVLREYTSDSSKFPWKWYGDVPKSGNAHSYLCSILRPYISIEYRMLIDGRPTFRELQRAVDLMTSENADHLLKNIATYCGTLYGKHYTERKSVEHEVFRYLINEKNIREDLAKRIRKQFFLKEV